MIQRYSYDSGMEAWIISTDGMWIRHFDHKERVELLEAALRKLTEWDAKYPKGREWQYGLSMQIEHELDAICEEARLALTNDAGEGA